MSDAVAMPGVEPALAEIGRQLAGARASCGLTIADVARQIKLTPVQVEAIEAGRLERLPGGVFARGFVRNYARLVKLDPGTLLAGKEWQTAAASMQGPELPHSVNIPFPTGRKVRWRYVAIAGGTVLVLAVPVAIFEIYSDGGSSDAIAEAPPAELPRPQLARTEPVPPPVLVPDKSLQIERPAAEKPVLAATVDRNARKPEIRLRFDRQSWVEIRDRSGRKLISQLNAAGSEQTVSGGPPFTLVIGNAAGVHLTYNGERVDLAPHTKVDVARLTLD